jgi:hypothetical protein
MSGLSISTGLSDAIWETPVFSVSLTGPLIQGGIGSGDDLRLTSTSDATKGTINLGSATTGLFFDETNERLSLGGDGNTISVGGTARGVDWSIHNDEGPEVCSVVFRYSDAAARAACMWGARSRGTLAAPTVVQSGDRILLIQGLAFDGTDYEIPGNIELYCDGTPGAGDMPGQWRFNVSPDGSATPAEAFRISSDKSALFAGSAKSNSATAGIGYDTGAGGAVTQITDRTTGVTVNTVCGNITLVSAAGSTTYQSFTVTNSTVAANDSIRVVQKSGTDLYEIHVTAVAAGSFRVTFRTTGGTTTEQPVFNFAVIKAVAA